MAVFHAERNARLIEKFASDFGDNHPVVGYGYRDAHNYFMNNLERFNPWKICLKHTVLDEDNPLSELLDSMEEEEFDNED